MKRTLVLCLALASALAASAGAAQRPAFPDVYVTPPCAASHVPISFPKHNLVAQGAVQRGFELDSSWIEKHWNDLMAVMNPASAQMAACYATPNNTYLFCNEINRADVARTCMKYPMKSRDYEQCIGFYYIYYLGIDSSSKALYTDAQKCANEQPAVAHNRPPEVWFSPEHLPVGYKGNVTVFAVDPDTHVPVEGVITVDKQTIYSTASYDGKVRTSWPFPWNAKLNREPNASGHTDVVAPRLTLDTPGYPTMTFTMPYDIPKVVVDITPSPDSWKRGVTNTITVHAKDASNGKPVEMRVYANDLILGNTNQPLRLELARNAKLPEIWATSLFNQYSDVVVVPAGK
ncbi:MAG: hypothetical protein JO197_11330 [Acidobacteria bacterium]|nr:hypothetical protein [Acidobacteriota bacterium]MBV9476067.1 hypothetical protein [Acidobacteriota bacterium]